MKIKKGKEPIIRVGLMQDKQNVKFSIREPFTILPENGLNIHIKPNELQTWQISVNQGLICENISSGEKYSFPESGFIRLEPDNPDKTLTILHNVTIGIEFHWQRDEDDDFPYILEFRKSNNNLIMVINELPVEKYLESVISSEMSGNCPEALLKAHTIIARSWLIAQMENLPHHHFLVCHDDHCQRYQGMRRWTPSAGKAVQETKGEILTYQGIICDTRYSKSCGGISENFENCWKSKPIFYCQSIPDMPENESRNIPNLMDENNVRQWILSRPKAFCNATASELELLLNEYDREIQDLFRWKIIYAQDEISRLIEKKSNKIIGQLKEIKTGRRGPSGRLLSLDFIGTKGNIHLEDQLEIRRLLSPSHLYSSCFVVDMENIKNNIPEKFVLHGAGWGHGVGLCQIGAAVMSIRGYDYRQILFHYYRDTKLNHAW